MLILICGRTHAGKTTFSKQYPGTIHLDEAGPPLNRYAAVNTRVSQEMGSVTVEGIYSRPEARRALCAAYTGKYRLCVWLDPPEEILAERRKANGLAPFYHAFTPPELAEGWDAIIHIQE